MGAYESPRDSSPTGGRKSLSPPPKSPDQLGFYMPNSPFAKMDGDFTPDKKFTLAKLTAAQEENQVRSNHHEGRKWSLTLSLMALKTGAFREVKTAYPTPYGGHNVDGTNFLIPEGRIALAHETARMRRRVASRRAHSNPAWFKSEQKKINQELWAAIGRANLPTKRAQTGSPTTTASADSPRSSAGSEESEEAEVGSPDNVMDAILAA